jgi:hypothetical protein
MLLITFTASRNFVTHCMKIKIALLYDNAQSDSAHVYVDRIQKNGWEILPILPTVWT